jgi:hypothetical protein
MEVKMNEGAIVKALDWAYDMAMNGIDVRGVVGMDSAQKLADDYLKQEGTLIEQVNSLIRWQNTKAGTSGFLAGLGGVITMPLTVPANVASVMLVQIRMIAAIAHMGGYDLKDEKVRTMVYACMVGSAASDILKDVGIVVGSKLATSAIRSITKDTIIAINKAVGFRLLTKFGQTGAVNLGKAVPLIGGIVGATFDSVTTNLIGNAARSAFIGGNGVKGMVEA